eukprot:755022-Hanusia_phi.AAC.4
MHKFKVNTPGAQLSLTEVRRSRSADGCMVNRDVQMEKSRCFLLNEVAMLMLRGWILKERHVSSEESIVKVCKRDEL